MKFTDIFINKPVLAIVVSLFILLFGMRSFTELNVRQYPELRNAVVNISTTQAVSRIVTQTASRMFTSVNTRTKLSKPAKPISSG